MQTPLFLKTGKGASVRKALCNFYISFAWFLVGFANILLFGKTYMCKSAKIIGFVNSNRENVISKWTKMR